MNSTQFLSPCTRNTWKPAQRRSVHSKLPQVPQIKKQKQTKNKKPQQNNGYKFRMLTAYSMW